MVTFSSYPADPRPRRAVDALLKEGMNVDLICLSDLYDAKHENLNGLDVLRIPISHERSGKLLYLYNYCAFIAVAAVILAIRTFRRRYDLIHVHNMPDVLVFCSLLPKVLGAKVILDMHDPMPELMTTIFNVRKDSLVVGLLKRLEKWSMARADRVITVNLACKRIFSSRSCRAQKIGIVMNSPANEIFPFRPVNLQPRAARHAARFVLMYHGSLVERNGLDLAVDALVRVREFVPTAELRIYGRKTPFLEKVLAQAAEKGLREFVRYLGPKTLEELVREIDDCDAGVIPNHRSAFADINTPTRIFEYLARGKPVVAPRTPGICDYFDEQSLILFEAGDALDLADRITYVYTHPDEVTEIVQRGQVIQQQRSWPSERHRFIEFVRGLWRNESADESETRANMQISCATKAVNR
jgi:glycosyltransferase involved in cell wall biosynthesis